VLEPARNVVPERDVGSPEAIDALLRIADEHDARRSRINLGDTGETERDITLR
jgi:hypothetical protein